MLAAWPGPAVMKEAAMKMGRSGSMKEATRSPSPGTPWRGERGTGLSPNDYYLKGFHTTAVVAGWGGTGGPTGDAWTGMREGAGEGEGR